MSNPRANGLTPVESKVAAYLPVFPIMSAQLKGTMTQIEEAVVEVCGGFQGISAHAHESVSKAAAFLDSRESSGGYSVEGLIRQCRNTMESLLAAIDHMDDVSRRAVEQMRAIDAYANEIGKALKSLHDIAEGNKILAINARIEAAHAGAQGTGFAIVANEVNTQAQKSCEVIEKVGGLAVSLRGKANAAVTDLEALASQNKLSATESRDEVTEALNSFGDMHSRMEELLSSMTRDGQLLEKEVATAIHGLQFQDRTSQRISHVMEALETLYQRFTEFCEGFEAAPDHNREEFFHLYTMKEEWQAAGIHQEHSSGDIELF